MPCMTEDHTISPASTHNGIWYTYNASILFCIPKPKGAIKKNIESITLE